MYRDSKYLVSQVVSFVERSIIHCPYLRGSPIGGFTVAVHSTCTSTPYSAMSVNVDLPQ